MANLFTEIGFKIQEYLDEKGMSQKDLADKIGVSKQVMSKIVHGKKAISLIELAKIAEIMGVSIDSLIQNEKSYENNDPVLLMMGYANNPNTHDELRFLNHVMDEMIALKELTAK